MAHLSTCFVHLLCLCMAKGQVQILSSGESLSPFVRKVGLEW